MCDHAPIVSENAHVPVRPFVIGSLDTSWFTGVARPLFEDGLASEPLAMFSPFTQPSPQECSRPFSWWTCAVKLNGVAVIGTTPHVLTTAGNESETTGALL